MIESNMIYNFEDFRALVSDKAKEGAYYFVLCFFLNNVIPLTIPINETIAKLPNKI